MSDLEVQVADPRPINLTESEKAALTPDQLKRWQDEIDRQVYGHDAKRDRHGNFVEQGIGSGANKNANHFREIANAEKRGDLPPGTHAKEVSEFWKDYPDQAKRIGLQRA